jgi:anti-sigma regulatory factor (Ser/Thr protein kinase)
VITGGSTRVFDPRDRNVLADVRGFVGEQVGAASPAFLYDLQLAVTEACANAVRHSGTDEIRVSIDRDGACVEVVVADDGVYSMTLPVPAADGQHRGMYLMTTMVDDFHLTRGTEARTGTVVRLLKCPPSSEVVVDGA